MVFLLLFFIMVLGVSIFFFIRSLRYQAFVPDKPVSENTISLYGDSISFAGALNPTPAQALAQFWQVSNYAISGMTFDNLITGFSSIFRPDVLLLPIEQQMVNDKNKVILIRLGINDALLKNNIFKFEDNIYDFIFAARINGHVPVLSGLSHTTDPTANDRRKKYNAVLERVAKETKTFFIDIGSVPYINEELPDGLHPGQSYSTRLDNFIIKYLQDNVFLKADK